MYQYNGKELNEEFGLGWNDYGARFYDAAVGRFTTVDRYADKYAPATPYQYGALNPIKFIDINGDSIDVYAPDGSHLYTLDDGKKEISGLYFQESSESKEGGVEYSNGVSFTYNDIDEDRSKALKGRMKFQVVSDSDIDDEMRNAGVNGVKDGIGFAWKESDTGKMDFWVSSTMGLENNILYISQSKLGTSAYNGKDFGNYLWGQAARRVGLNYKFASTAAHINNALWGDDQNSGDVPFFDTPADQRAIKNGYFHFSTQDVKISHPAWKN